MKKLVILAAIAGFASPAFANEIADSCREYAAANNSDDSGCDCIGEAAMEDEALAAALAEIQTPEDVEAADDATKAALAACFPA